MLSLYIHTKEQNLHKLEWSDDDGLLVENGEQQELDIDDDEWFRPI
jgi:hypothetical protein